MPRLQKVSPMPLNNASLSVSPSDEAILLLDNDYLPTKTQPGLEPVPFLAIWVKTDAPYQFPWESLPKESWSELENWALNSGGSARIYFGQEAPTISVTFYPVELDQVRPPIQEGKPPSNLDWCDDTGQFTLELDSEGRAFAPSWFPDNPSDSKNYYLAWDDEQSGYWSSCLDDEGVSLENSILCTVSEAIALAEIFMDYSLFRHQGLRLIQEEAQLGKIKDKESQPDPLPRPTESSRSLEVTRD